MTVPENPRPTGDLVFRKLFGSEENTDILMSIINSIVAQGDPDLREIFEAEEKARMVDRATLRKAEERGEKLGIQRSIEQGIERGIEQGKHLGQIHLLTRLLTRHLGELPEEVAVQLDQLTSNQLDALGGVLLDFRS